MIKIKKGAWCHDPLGLLQFTGSNYDTKKALKKLSEAGYTTYILGGEFKATTEAIVGDETGDDTDNDV